MSRRPYDDRDEDRYRQDVDRYDRDERRSRRDDDRDDDRHDDREPMRRPAPESGGSSAVPILAIIGGVLVVVLLVCGGLGFYIFYSVQQGARQVGNTFAKTVDKQQEQFGKLAEKQQEQFAKAVEKMEKERQQEEEQRKKEQAQEKKERDKKAADRRKAMQLANNFIADLKTNQTAEAYAATSAAFRKRTSQEQLAQQAREHADALNRMSSFRDLGFYLPDQDLNPPYTFSDTKPTFGAFIKVEVTVVKEDDAWKVDRWIVSRSNVGRK